MQFRLLLFCLFLPLIGFSINQYPIIEIADAIYEDTSHSIKSPDQLKEDLLVTAGFEKNRKLKSAYWFQFTVREPQKNAC